MTDEQFDALVDLIKGLAYRATGAATHQRRAGTEHEDIEEARAVLVDDEPNNRPQRREVMVPYGQDHPDYPNAPSDWDGGPYRCRDGGLYHMRGYGWKHGWGCWNATSDWDRVAYSPKAADNPEGEK